MTASLFAAPYSYFTDDNGVPLAGGKIYTYAAGTTTPKATYTDYTGVTPLANPVVLDSAGRATIWGIGSYYIEVKNATGTLIRATDNVAPSSTSGDMTKAVYDPASINEQLVGLTAVQTLSNKTLTGTATNDSAAAGKVGEEIASTVLTAAGVSLTTNTAKTITSIALTAGDWELSGMGQFTGGATTTVVLTAACYSTATDTFTNAADMSACIYYGGGTVFNTNVQNVTATIMPLRVSLAAPTTYYLVAYSTFSTSTAKAFGKIKARRWR